MTYQPAPDGRNDDGTYPADWCAGGCDTVRRGSTADWTCDECAERQATATYYVTLDGDRLVDTLCWEDVKRAAQDARDRYGRRYHVSVGNSSYDDMDCDGLTDTERDAL